MIKYLFNLLIIKNLRFGIIKKHIPIYKRTSHGLFNYFKRRKYSNHFFK